MKTFKKGAAVRLVQPIVAGVVMGGVLSEEGDKVDYRVVITLPSGEYHVRSFSGEDLEEVEGDAADALQEEHAKHVAGMKARMVEDLEHSIRHETESLASAPADKVEAIKVGIESHRSRLAELTKEAA